MIIIKMLLVFLALFVSGALSAVVLNWMDTTEVKKRGKKVKKVRKKY